MEMKGRENDSGTNESPDIHDYLSSFNKEIQDGTCANSSEVDKSNDNDELQEPQTESCGEAGKSFATYYSTSDGTLYPASQEQGDFSQQISFLPPASAHGNNTGLQHILLAVGDVSGISTVAASDVSIPVHLPSQFFAAQNVKITAPVANSHKEQQNGHLERVDVKTEILEEDYSAEVTEFKENSGTVYLNSSSSPAAVMVVQSQVHDKMSYASPVSNSNQQGITEISNDKQNNQQTLQVVTSLTSPETDNSAVINSGSAYQAVTIVPSDTNPGELSYVLFLTQPKENENSNENMDQHDFSNEEKVLKSVEEGNGFKTLTLRLAQRPTQIIAQQHTCNYCDYSSPKRYLLSRHLKSHSDDRPHKCTVCGRGFKTLASLHNHVNTHTGTRPHACKECKSCFTTSGELVRHVRYKHTHEKPHHCNECDYASVELSKLKRHMRCHTGERPYQCPHCTYASPDTYKLKRHMRIHTGEKPYECNICSSRFTQSNSLKAHKLIHSGTKPIFQCDFCPTTCGRKTDLRIHVQKLHSAELPHHCKHCDAVFEDQSAFKLHCKKHESDDDGDNGSLWSNLQECHVKNEMLNCDECDQSFNYKNNLSHHKNCCHNANSISVVPEENNNTCTECNESFHKKDDMLHHLVIHDPSDMHEESIKAVHIEDCVKNENTNIEIEDDCEENDERKQQMVVFKLIQISGNSSNYEHQALTAADGHAVMLDGSEAFTIVQQVSSDGKISDVPLSKLPNAMVDTSDFQELGISDASENNKSTKSAKKRKVASKSRCTPGLPSKNSRSCRIIHISKELQTEMNGTTDTKDNEK